MYHISAAAAVTSIVLYRMSVKKMKLVTLPNITSDLLVCMLFMKWVIFTQVMMLNHWSKVKLVVLLVGYLTEREADGVNVIDWYHRQFIDVCKERYFRNLNFLNEIHSNIAEYFMGKWDKIC